MKNIKKITLFGLCLLASAAVASEIEPTWESLAVDYQVPQWFVDGKIGVWMHWGISSAVDANRPNDGSWYGRNMYGGGKALAKTLSEWHTKRYGPPSEFGYEKLIPLFKAEKWDPDALVKFVKDNGARFVMPVACHHDNFDMYASFHPWNSVNMGPKRDTLKEWKAATTKHGLKFGVSTHLYWSPGWYRPARKYQKEGTLEWKLFNMDYDARGYNTQDSWNEHWYARCWEIIEKYDPDMFNNDSPYPKIGGGKGLGIKLFTDYINRDLKENNGEQTVVLSFKDAKVDRRAFTYNLERGSAGEIKPEPWMWATDLSGGWFYRATAVNKMSIPVMVANGVDAISKNGIVMLNIALKGDGTIPEKQIAYLTAFGDFLKINGEGIYGTRPWKSFGEGPLKVKDGRQGENHRDFSQQDIRFTTKGDTLYAFVLAKPTSDIEIKTLARDGIYEGDIGTISLLGSAEMLTWERSADALRIQLPKTLSDQPVIGFRISSTGTSTAAAVQKTRQKTRAAREVKRSKYLETGGQRELEVLFKKVAGKDLFLDLYYPTGSRTEKYPVIAFTHGGGWAAGNRYKAASGSFGSIFTQLIKEGFAVAPVSYRLAKKDSNVAIRDCVIDCKDAIRFLAKNSESLGIDPMRVYVMGDSAGGHIAQMLLLTSPDSLPGDPTLADVSYRMVAGVSWYGPCDFEQTDLFNHDDRPNFRDRFGPRLLGSDSGPQDKLARYREMSPINYLTSTSPPLLMIQGNKDTTIPVKHAYYMQKKAEKLKAPVEIMIIKNAGHNWRKVDADIEPSREVIIERTVQFFVDHL